MVTSPPLPRPALWSPPRPLQRVVFDYSDMLVGPGNTAVLERGIAEVARK